MRLIVFDCDGTLVDSQHLIVAAMHQAFETHGLSPPAPEDVRRIIGLSLEEAIGRLTPDRGQVRLNELGFAYRQAFVGLREAIDHHEPLFPGAEAALRRLSGDKDVLLGIATGKSRRGVQVFLDRFGLDGCFATIQTADDAPSKPHPAMLDQAIAETGADPAQTIMVGDTSFDMMMARSAGVSALGVTWGYHAPDELLRAGAHRLASDFDELERAFDDVHMPKDAAE